MTAAAPSALESLIEAGWRDHAGEPLAVFERLLVAAEAAKTPSEAHGLARLVAHVGGEHLGRFDESIELLERLAALASLEEPSLEGQGIQRLLAALYRCADRSEAAERALMHAHPPEWPVASTRARVLAAAAAMRVGQGELDEGAADLEAAVALAAYGPGAADPAARDLAVTGNNLACALEERGSRTPAETALMLRAAQIARRFWAVAGGWMQVERAEYRLCMSHLAAGQPAAAVAHAAECLRIVREHGGEPGESFFAHEASARAALAQGDLPGAAVHFEAATDCLPSVEDESLRGFCAEELTRLGALLGQGA